MRSVKYHVKRVVGVHTLTYEEFSTLLCQVEACLNSRPLAPLTDHFDDYTTLTPGHFLIGSALKSIPVCSQPLWTLTFPVYRVGNLFNK